MKKFCAYFGWFVCAFLAVATAKSNPQDGTPPASGNPRKEFTLAVIPDPQHYADKVLDFQYQDRWPLQIHWIKASRERLNIVFVSVVGDIVQNFGQFPQEWNIARNSINVLHEGGDPHAPTITPFGYSISIGNHDYDVKQWSGYHPTTQAVTNIVHGTSFWQQRFGASAYENHGFAWWGGSDAGFVYGQPILGQNGPWTGEGLNRYQRFEGGGRTFLHLSLELGVPDYAIAWADQVIASNPGHPIIVSTHALINSGGAFLDVYGMWREDVGNSGQQVWDKFLKRHPRIFMVLCGHSGVQRNVTLLNDAGKEVFVFLTDYAIKHLPGEESNGAGWLRYYTFDPVQQSIRGRTYSPVLAEYATNAGGTPAYAYPPAASGDPRNGNWSDFTIVFDWDERFK